MRRLFVLLLLTAVGCASSPSSPPRPVSPDVVANTCPRTLSGSQRALLEPVPAGFRAREVLLCANVTQHVAGDGVWVFVTEKRATNGVDRLVSVLRRPDTKSRGVVCPAIAVAEPWFALVDAHGTAIRPRVPRDECGQPQPAVLATLGSLRFRTVRETKSTQQLTELAYRSGCASAWKDLFAFDNGAVLPGLHALPWVQVRTVRLCVYQSQPTDVQVGRLVAAGTLDGARLTEFLAAAGAAPRARACSARHTRFAVLVPVPLQEAGYLELDGCGRLAYPGRPLTTLIAAARTVIARSAGT